MCFLEGLDISTKERTEMKNFLATKINTTLDESVIVPTVKKTVWSPSAENFFCKGKEGMWYYDILQDDGTGTMSAGPTIYRELLKRAKKEIRIWDPYINEQDACLFKGLSANITVWILTCCLDERKLMGSNSDRTFEQDAFLRELQYVDNAVDGRLNFILHIASIVPKRVNQFLPRTKLRRNSQAIQRIMHDRFLFIDNEEVGNDHVYIVGSSLNYHSVEETGDVSDIASTLIYEVREPAERRILRESFNSFWGNASRSKFAVPLR